MREPFNKFEGRIKFFRIIFGHTRKMVFMIIRFFVNCCKTQVFKLSEPKEEHFDFSVFRTRYHLASILVSVRPKIEALDLI